MSWIKATDATSSFEGLLGQRPQLLEHYRKFYRTFWEDQHIPRRILEACRLRIAAIHDCEQEWQLRDESVTFSSRELQQLRQGLFDGFDPDEQSALCLAEKMSYQHHQIDDAEVGRSEELLGTPATVNLLTALAFFDVTCRLKLILEVDDHNGTPPIANGKIA